MIRNTTQFQLAYILHARPYRDSSLLLDVFSESQGRVSLIAKAGRGVYGKKARFKGLLQAFIPLLLSWKGKNDLKNLSAAEPSSFFSTQLSGKYLIYGLYLNELLSRLLYRDDPHPRLFQAYQVALRDLNSNPVVALRLFEKRLLTELGYALQLSGEQLTDQSFLRDQFYQFSPSQGLVISLDKSSDRTTLFSGSSLLAMHYEQWDTPQQLRDAKRLFKLVLNYLLEGQVIRSRELLLNFKDR